MRYAAFDRLAMVFPGARQWTATKRRQVIGDNNNFAAIFQFLFSSNQISIRSFASSVLSAISNTCISSVLNRNDCGRHNHSVYQFEIRLSYGMHTAHDSFTCHVSFSIQLCELCKLGKGMVFRSRRTMNEYTSALDWYIRCLFDSSIASITDSLCLSFAFCLYIYCY